MNMRKYIVPIILAIIIIFSVVKGANNGSFNKFGDRLSGVKQNFKNDMREVKEEIKESLKNKTETIKEKVTKKEKYPKVSIYNLNMYPELYDRQNISVKGIIIDSINSNCVRLADDDGLYVLIQQFIGNRVFDFGNPNTGKKGAYYIAKGIFYNQKFDRYSQHNFYLEATEPLIK